MKNGGNWERHTRAMGFSGGKKPNFVVGGKRCRSHMRTGNVRIGLLGRLNAVMAGFSVAEVAIHQMGKNGMFDQRKDWSVNFLGDECCEPPRHSTIVGIGIHYSYATADVYGVLWGLGGYSKVLYEFEKRIDIYWECCCESNLLGLTDFEVKTVRSAGEESWLGGAIGYGTYTAYGLTIEMNFPCDN
jgi:hypothetical protein